MEERGRERGKKKKEEKRFAQTLRIYQASAMYLRCVNYYGTCQRGLSGKSPSEKTFKLMSAK